MAGSWKLYWAMSECKEKVVDQQRHENKIGELDKKNLWGVGNTSKESIIAGSTCAHCWTLSDKCFQTQCLSFEKPLRLKKADLR